MSIARSQMNRQLYAGGGIMELAPRSKFGLGSKLKKFVRNIIPNEISSIAVKAAPFVAPFNPLLAAGMAGIGGFDQSGSLSNALKSGLLTYGGGQFSRFLGGAGFQQGINPFAGYNPSASFGGLGSLFTSPIGTTSGLKLGQYELFGGPGSEAFKAGQNIANVGQQTYTGGAIDPNTGLPFGVEASEGAIKTGVGLPSNQFYPTDFSSQPLPIEYATDTTAKALTSTITPGVTSTTPGYTDLFKQLLSGDLSQKTEAIKQLGGKALKDIYTTKAKDGSTQIDKLALGATIAGGMSYFEAQKAAKEADLIKEEEEYTKAMYEADRQRYKDYYSQILKPEYFGITAKAKGGRVGFAFGSEDPSIREGITSITLTKEEDGKNNTQVAGMSNNRVAQLMALLEDPNIDDDYRKQIQDEIRLLMSKKDGGRIGYKDGKDPYDKLESKIVSINPMQDDLESQLGIGAMALAPGLAKIMSRGVPTFTSAEKTLVIRNLAGRGKGTEAYKELGMTIPEVKKIMDNPAKNLKDATILKEFIKTVMGKKDGGRIGYAKGSKKPIININPYEMVGDTGMTVVDFYYGGDIDAMIEAILPENYQGAYTVVKPANKAEGGIMDLRDNFAMGSEVPIRQNQVGVPEMDYRDTGGFVPPIGVKEKADDIPAMLSNNEFVFTADAVKAAGGGSVNKGAQKMYALMKQLEGQVV